MGRDQKLGCPLAGWTVNKQMVSHLDTLNISQLLSPDLWVLIGTMINHGAIAKLYRRGFPSIASNAKRATTVTMLASLPTPYLSLLPERSPDRPHPACASGRAVPASSRSGAAAARPAVPIAASSDGRSSRADAGSPALP